MPERELAAVQAREQAQVDARAARYAIGEFSADVSQATDEDVGCLQAAAAPASRPPTGVAATDPPGRGGELPSARGQEVEPAAGEVRLAGYLTVPGTRPGS